MSRLTFNKKICQNILLLTTDKNFINDINKIRKQFKIPEKIYLYFESPKFETAVENLRKRYNLSKPHQYYLKVFILADYVNSKANNDYPFSPTLFLGRDKDKSLIIKLSPETTLKDIQMAWSVIEKRRNELLGYKPKKQSQRKNLKRDLYILELKNQGKPHKKIRDIINKKFNTTIGYEDISKIIQRLKNAKDEIVTPKET